MALFARNAGKIGRIISSVMIIVTLLIPVASVHAAGTYHIAASDSSGPDKAAADAVCDGTADQAEINTYLTSGSTVILYAGTFNINGNINATSSSHLYGQGNTSILNSQGGGINISNVSNVEVDHLKIQGAVSSGTINSAVFVGASTTNVASISIHDISDNATGTDGMDLYVSSHSITGVVFKNITITNPSGFGFCNLANGPSLSNVISNIVYFNCSVTNAGTGGGSLWATGFDLDESASGTDNLTINGVYVIKSSVNGAWESDFHMEGGSFVCQNVVFTGNDATNAGQKPGFLYGFGYLINGDTVVYGNTASTNGGGDEIINGVVHTPMIDAISPSGSSKTASLVAVGNASGVMINTDATHKELVLYSNNGSPVDQWIELGGHYVADDGGSYNFSTTQIEVQFSDYAVIKLVASTSWLTSIAVTPNPPSHLKVGSTQQFAATGTYSDNSNVNLTSSVTWVSSNASVATIATGGLATGVDSGNTEISANMSGVFSSNVTLTVKKLSSIAVTPNPSVNLAIGSDEQFSAVGTYTDASTENITSSSSWVSSNTTVATVTVSGGLAHGLVAGTTNISASKSGITSGNVSLTVLTPVATLISIAVTPTLPDTLLTGGTQQFVATGTYNDNSTAIITSSVVWISSDTTRAYISASGLATGVATGSTTITSSLSGVTSPGITLSVLAYGSGGLTSGSKFAQDIFPMVVVLAPVLLAFKLVDTGEGGPLTGLIVFGVMVTIAVAFLTVIAPILNGL